MDKVETQLMYNSAMTLVSIYLGLLVMFNAMYR